MTPRGLLTSAVAAAAFIVLAAPASAATIAASSAVDRSCTARALQTGAGYVRQTVAAPSPGSVTARLDGSGGDWDLAVFDAVTGRLIAGSAHRGSHEVASGYTSQATVSPSRPAGSPAARAPRR